MKKIKSTFCDLDTTFLATCLMAVLQLSRYSIFHSEDTPIQLSLPWWSYPCQCLNTEISARGNKCQDRWQWTLFYFLFSLYFTFLFFFLFNFLLEQLRLGFICHSVTSVTNWWCSHKTDHKTWEKEVEGSRTKWCHTAWTTHTGLMLYSWSFRVGCTVASTDHGE